MHTEPIPRLYPLQDRIDTEAIADYDESTGMYVRRMTVDYILPDYPMRLAQTDDWETWYGRIRAYAGGIWDGASGPVIQGPHTVVASDIHDIVCTTVDIDGPVLPGYFCRHALYRRICIAQGMPRARAWLHWWALTRANWLYSVTH